MAEIALLDTINESAREAFVQAGLSVANFEKSVTQDELAVITDGALVLGVRSGPPVTGEAISDTLEAISIFGGGFNHITRETEEGEEPGADERGVALFNAAHENTRSVAELVIGGTLSAMRNIPGHNRALHEGEWTKEDGREAREKTMGIIGYGGIGMQVGTMAEGLTMRVVAYDPEPKVPRQGGTKLVGSVEEVLEVADVATLHVPGMESTRHMINADTIALMKAGSYLVNMARGDLVDYEAVRAALDSGQLAGVVADVYTDASIGYTEPAKKGDPFEHPLRGHPKAILLPHIGGSTTEAQSSIGEAVAQRAIGYLRTGSSVGSVNIPNLALDVPEPGISRLLNLHDNHPGVLAESSGVLSDAGFNIVGASHKAEGKIGYAALDVEGEIPEDVVAAVGSLPATRRVRVIS